MTQGTISTKIVIKKADIRKNFETLLTEFKGFRINRSDTGDSLDLLILELGNDIKKDLRTVDTIIRKGKVENVFLTGEKLDANVLLQAIRIGVKEFFPQPLDEEEIRAALARLSQAATKKDADDKPRKGKIITLVGSKGGVGTTTLAVNMATSLAEKGEGFETALVDMNVIFGDIPLFFDIQPGYHWGEILKNIDRLDATLLDSVLTHHVSGVHILPSPVNLNDGLHSIHADVIERLLETMSNVYDYIIIDNGLSMGRNFAKILEMSDLCFLVAVLTLPCLANTSKVIKTIEAIEPDAGEDKLRVVINRYLRKSTISLQDAAEGINNKIFWRIPNDYKLTMNAVNQGKTLKQIAPRALVTRSIEGLAETFSEKEPMLRTKRWKLF
jgi:pilus assembly protein CpaE